MRQLRNTYYTNGLRIKFMAFRPVPFFSPFISPASAACGCFVLLCLCSTANMQLLVYPPPA
jgi:hypothetical protein